MIIVYEFVIVLLQIPHKVKALFFKLLVFLFLRLNLMLVIVDQEFTYLHAFGVRGLYRSLQDVLVLMITIQTFLSLTELAASSSDLIRLGVLDQVLEILNVCRHKLLSSPYSFIKFLCLLCNPRCRRLHSL